MNDQPNSNKMKEWFMLLEELCFDNSDVSEKFKKHFKEFWERITSLQLYHIYSLYFEDF